MKIRLTALLTVIAAVVLSLIAVSKYAGVDAVKITGFAVSDGEINKLADAPKDRITEDQIRMSDGTIVIKLAGATIGQLEDTGSMKPLLDANSNTLMIKPERAEDIKEGDIVAYQSEEAEGLVVHRVAKRGIDENGWFAIAKGDNSKANDPKKVRFRQIKYVVVGILY